MASQRQRAHKPGAYRTPMPTLDRPAMGSGREGVGKLPQGAAGPWSPQRWLEELTPVVAAAGWVLDEPQLEQLAAYMVMLSHWNGTYNLTALRDPVEMLSHHLADCLAVLRPLQRHMMSAPQRGVPPAPVDDAKGENHAPVGFRLLDVGSGGGLPGVVLAICMPTLRVTCVDTVGKKAAFIRQVAAQLGLRHLRAEHARVEQLRGTFDLITSRAFASLADFVALTRPLLEEGGVWMAMKGKVPDAEVQALPAGIEVFHVEQLAVPGLGAERCLVWLRPKDVVRLSNRVEA